MQAVVCLLLLLASTGALAQSCVGRCGTNDGTTGCQCNSVCATYGDCCVDYNSYCLSCVGRCGEAYVYSKPCQCNVDCPAHGNCCVDFADLCGGGTGGAVTTQELLDLSEEFFLLDTNSVKSQIVVNYQGATTSSATNDVAPDPLFTSVPDSALSGPTISLLVALQDNYIPAVGTSEVETAAEVTEKEAFLDAIMATPVMLRAEEFLLQKGLLTGTLRNYIDFIWFTMYTRSGSVLGSSGFEHSFVGELKNGVSGFHNWVNFYTEEKAGNINYQGVEGSVTLGSESDILMHRFTWLGSNKPIGSMWIGTPPELELASYTVCFLARPNALCPVSMNGARFNVQTYTLTYNGMVLVGSAYPDII